MPSALMKRSSAIWRRSSIAATSLAALTSPQPSRSAMISAFSRKMSPGWRMRPSSQNSAMCFEPSPSMSKQSRATKCFSRSTAWAAQIRPPVQRRTTMPSSRTARLPQIGHFSGYWKGRASFGRRSRMTPTICGITSPARWTMTVSPMRTSLRAISSSLCKVARCTTTPPTVIGSSTATGVSAPCRPTDIRMSRSTVVACCAGNLCARAQRGALLADHMIVGQSLLDAGAQPRMLVDRKPPAAKAFERLLMGAGEGPARFAPVIGEEFQWPARGNRGIELAQRAGGDIARVGEDRLAGGGALLVDREKPGALHIDFAAHLDHLGPIIAREHLRHGLQRSDILGHVLAGDAIAARRADRQPALFVAQRGRQPVDLRLGHDLDAGEILRVTKEPPDAVEEIADV